jgi:hypothetical protein
VSVHALTFTERAEAVRLADTLTVEQLREWIRYPSGTEWTTDAMGFGVDMSPIGCAAFRHRVATDIDAAAHCVLWDGPPPAVSLTVCPYVGGDCDPAACARRGCQR